MYNEKNEIRRKILTLLRKQEEKERLNKSLVICSKLLGLQELQNASSVLFYASFDGEVETFEMMTIFMEQGKTISLPKVDKKKNIFYPYKVTTLESLQTGSYGIKEPDIEQSQLMSYEDLDIVLVPAVAFDTQNNRLGRGFGYYDRFLSSLPKNIISIGLAFDFQIVKHLPYRKDHDMAVMRVLTN